MSAPVSSRVTWISLALLVTGSGCGLCVMLDTIILPTQPPGWNDRGCSEIHGVLCEIDFVP